MRRALPLLALAVTACPGESRPPAALAGEVKISEVVSSNLGGGPHAGRDERGEWDDWIELENVTDHDVDLAGLFVSDHLGQPDRHQIPLDPAFVLKAGGRVLLFADGEPHQGSAHLPFLLSKKGEGVVISTVDRVELDAISVPPLATGESYAKTADVFEVCLTPTPNKPKDCLVLPTIPKRYEPYAWPTPWPPVRDAPVLVSEVSRTFVELENHGGAIDLADLSLTFGALVPPAVPAPPLANAVTMSGTLAPGARVAIDVALPDGAAIALMRGSEVLDVVTYEALGDDVLARPDDGTDLHLRCAAASATPGAAYAGCAAPVVTSSVAPPYLRGLRSDADLARLAESDAERTSDSSSVKFVIDRLNGDTVYFMDSNNFPLHFDWVWEVIEKKQPFDLCDPQQRAIHDSEWVRFSQRSYFNTVNRPYYLGTVVFYRDSDLYTIEFASGDRITPEQIREAFFLVAEKVADAKRLFVRPTTASFEERMAQLEGHVPIVPAGAPFEGTHFVALNPGVAYGVLQRVEDVEEAALTFQTIPIFTRIPNDVPLVSGTITEELQTPLAHVNVLAQNRGTPNMALIDASTDPRVAPFLDRLVRLEVTKGDFTIRAATSTEAEAFWEERFGSRPPFTPERDLSVRDIVDLSTMSIDDVPRIGAKAAQYAELMNLDFARFGGACAVVSGAKALPVPRPAFAIPFARYVDHLERNGIDDAIAELLADLPEGPTERRAALDRIRDRIEDAPVDPDFLAALESRVSARYGLERVRLRSSTNVEDLVGFNGAGLYTSESAQANSTVRPLADALRKVWASTFTYRAFEERRLFNVDETQVAMGVLIHRGFPGEEANGVAITKNIIDPARSGYYINAQVGEISIVNPEGDFVAEQLLYKSFNPPEVSVLVRSSVTNGAPVLSTEEAKRLACAIGAAHNRFADHYTDVVSRADFALDVEFKIDGPNRDVVIKQARPYIGSAFVESTCGE